MSDQPEDQEPVRAEIVGSFHEDASEGTSSLPYSVWLNATNKCAGIRHEAWENQVEVACTILFGPGPNGDGEHDEADKWKEGYEEGPISRIKDKVRLAAGEKLVRLMGPEFDPAPPIAYDPPPYFAAINQSDDEPDDESTCD